jgi:hypothetical protein
MSAPVGEADGARPIAGGLDRGGGGASAQDTTPLQLSPPRPGFDPGDAASPPVTSVRELRAGLRLGEEEALTAETFDVNEGHINVDALLGHGLGPLTAAGVGRCAYKKLAHCQRYSYNPNGTPFFARTR